MKRLLALVIAVAVSAWMVTPGEEAAAQDEKATSPIPAEETTAQVPALDDLHEVIYQLWHEAYPTKNYTLIKDLLPQADELTAKLDAAALPGILRDKQPAWDAAKEGLKESLAALRRAAETNDEPAMLTHTEAYHAAFEKLVRTIRPVVPELDAFHQELYKLYHYHAPAYDLEAIRADAAAMQAKVAPLAAATLPGRVAERQKDFSAAVTTLSSAVDDLVTTAKKDNRDKILAAVETVHIAYVRTEKIFD